MRPEGRIIVAILIGSAVSMAGRSPRAAGASDAALHVPLVAGLTTVSAVHEPGKGDYESIMRVSAVVPAGATFTVSANVDDRRISVRRRVARQDAETAHAWRPRYHEGDPETYGGATGGLGLSASVLAELKTGKATTFTAFIEEDDPLAALTRGLAQQLGQALGAYLLDEVALPLVLQFRIGAITSRVISIIVPSETAARDLESRLAKDGRTDVYGIYFDFSKATIRSESEIVLKAIADVLGKNPTWSLQVEGHTDNIGRAPANQDLSTRRSAAVRQALIDRYHIAPPRLTAQGFGASRPKDTNDTLEGRARNRRVELVKR
jgi:outer membrane protein OmpA-like peptidoglycan-associated protein